jgi:Histidine kinase
MMRSPPKNKVAAARPGLMAAILRHFSSQQTLRPNELILITVAPYWCYMMMWRMIMYSFFAAAEPDVAEPSLGVHYLSDLLLLPVLLIFCRIALAIRISKRRIGWLIPLHLLLGFIFAALREPAFRLAQHWIDGGPPLSDWWAHLLAEPRVYLNLWGGFAVQYTMIYTTAMGLLGGVLLYRHWREAEQRRLHLEAVTVRAELHALQMQLNPHFLFNALHLVTGLIDSDPTNAKRMVVRLGNFLRRVLDEGECEQISLGEELEFVEDYMAIQQARFGDRVSCVIDVGRQARDGLVPPLVLQPLIENAVKHGMGSEEANLRVDLSATMHDQWLDITIANAIPPNVTENLKGTGIGLRNLSERLAALYGELGRVEVAALPSGRFIANLRIPYETVAPA